MLEPQDTFQKRRYGDTFKSRRRVAIPPLAEARGLLARCIMKAKLDVKHINHINERMMVWKSGYGVRCDVNGKLFCYGVKK